MPKRICSICYKPTNQTEPPLTTPSRRPVCQHCLHHNFTRCHICTKMKAKSSIIRITDGAHRRQVDAQITYTYKKVCVTCFEKHVTPCPIKECGSNTFKDAIKPFKVNRKVKGCPRCYQIDLVTVKQNPLTRSKKRIKQKYFNQYEL